MKIYVMTDLEGVAGVLDYDNWCSSSGKYHEQARKFLTLEVNAAVEGFFEIGFREISVADGHTDGAIDPELLDSRAELIRGWPEGWPMLLDSGYDAVAWIGQHAKAGTKYAHLPHTGDLDIIDYTLNGVSIGDFGMLAACAGELGVPPIFGAGDRAFTEEARALCPDMETVAVKRGVSPRSGDELPPAEYGDISVGAVHTPPARARDMIREAAERAGSRFRSQRFKSLKLTPPYERVVTMRASAGQPKRVSRDGHPSSVIALMNTPLDLRPIEE